MFQLCCIMTLLGVHGTDDVIDDLKKALNTTGSAESYRFTVGEPGGAPLSGTYQKNEPVAMRADGIDFFRQANAMVYRNGNVWTKTRTGTLSDPLPILAASAKVHSVRLPHEELILLEKAIRSIKKADAADGAITAELNASGARALARSEDRDLARSGTVHFWVNAQGRISKYRLALRVQGTRGNTDVDGVVKRMVTVSHIGAAQVEAPEAVKALLRP